MQVIDELAASLTLLVLFAQFLGVFGVNVAIHTLTVERLATIAREFLCPACEKKEKRKNGAHVSKHMTIRVKQ